MPKRLHNIGVNETKVFVFNSVSEELVKWLTNSMEQSPFWEAKSTLS
jgi:hypothetical protein